jgi:tyrosyl-tRNA synthetase
MDKLNLIRRNTEEIITNDELEETLRKNSSPVTYCGYEVSGPVHLGTMVAVQKQLDFQDSGLKVKVLLADLHTYLNRKGAEEWIEEQVAYWRNAFLKLGLTKAEFIQGTDFQFERDYIKDVLSLGLETSLLRARRSMQEIARDFEHSRVSQMIYPLMQIADIKALGVRIAHGGMEQRKIHMLARELLPLVDYEKPVCIHTPLLASLQGPQEKMSSSKPETIIAVDEAPEQIKTKIKKAYCPPAEKEGNPILQICEYLIFPRTNKLEVKRKEKFGGDLIFSSYLELEEMYLKNKLHPQDLKNSVAEALVEILKPVRNL